MLKGSTSSLLKVDRFDLICPIVMNLGRDFEQKSFRKVKCTILFCCSLFRLVGILLSREIMVVPMLVKISPVEGIIT